jgi:hypothetical protein
LLCSYKRKPKRGFVKSLETLTRKLKVKGVSREKPLLERVLRRRQLPLEMELRPERCEGKSICEFEEAL